MYHDPEMQGGHAEADVQIFQMEEIYWAPGPPSVTYTFNNFTHHHF